MSPLGPPLGRDEVTLQPLPLCPLALKIEGQGAVPLHHLKTFFFVNGTRPNRRKQRGKNGRGRKGSRKMNREKEKNYGLNNGGNMGKLMTQR